MSTCSSAYKDNVLISHYMALTMDLKSRLKLKMHYSCLYFTRYKIATWRCSDTTRHWM